MEYEKIVEYNYIAERPIVLKDSIEYRCRFCGKIKEKDSFKDKAHSVAECIGNKSIINKFECDDCNKNFSENEENELGKLIQEFKAFRGLRGKKGITKIHSNVEFHYDETNAVLNVSIKEFENKNVVFELYKDDKGADVLRLHHRIELNGRLVYRSFLKFALSIIPEEFLDEFEPAFKFLKNDDMRNDLLIGYVVHKKLAREYKISIYRLKNIGSGLPKYVGLIDMYQMSIVIYLDYNNSCNFVPISIILECLGSERDDIYKSFIEDYSFTKRTFWQIDEVKGIIKK